MLNCNNNLTDINAVREKVRFKIGNHWSADADDNTTSWLTESDDYLVTYEGKPFCLSCAFCSEDGSSLIEEVEAPQTDENFEEIDISHVSQAVLTKVFFRLFPQGKEEEELVFLHGLERGLELYEEKTWMKLHCLLGEEEITKKAMEKIGRWDDEIFCTKPHAARVRRGQSCYEVYAPPMVIGKPGNLYDVSVTNFDPLEEEARKKAFGRKVRELADQARVPFKIAAMLWNLEDTDNLQALKAAHDAHIAANTLDDLTRHELMECGIGRRVDAIYRILGQHYANFFNLNGQLKSARLAAYLGGR